MGAQGQLQVSRVPNTFFTPVTHPLIPKHGRMGLVRIHRDPVGAAPVRSTSRAAILPLWHADLALHISDAA